VAAIAPALPEARGIIVFGSKGSWFVAAPAVEGESVPARSLAAAVVPWTALAVDDEEVPRVWLMLISCSSWFSEIICPTIAVGSTGAVGS